LSGRLSYKKPADIESEKADVEVEASSTPETDTFWTEFGQQTIKDVITSLDERAKFMITTCASLIVVNFGLLLAFEVHSFSIKVAPQFFLAVSAALFAISFFPITKRVNLQSPDSIENAYNTWMKWKLKCNRAGFFLFIVGLLAMAVTSMTGETST
jgi:hypothetical protein